MIMWSVYTFSGNLLAFYSDNVYSFVAFMIIIAVVKAP